MSIKREYDFDQVGHKDMYLLHHEEIESLAKNIPGRQAHPLLHDLRPVLPDPHEVFGERRHAVHHPGSSSRAIRSCRSSSLRRCCPTRHPRPRTKGKTNIGLHLHGQKGRQEKTAYIYNVCDHEACYREVGSQAISYTTGVPAMIGAAMLMTGKWFQARRIPRSRSSIPIRIWRR